LVLTDTYLIGQKFTFFDVRRLDDLLWAHHFVMRYTYCGITLWKSHEIRFAFEDRQLNFIQRKKNIQPALQYVMERVPWAVVGYADQLSTAYRKDRAGFVAAVAQRREELGNNPPMTQAEPAEGERAEVL
jgi:hypothetical protein